jgi:hypothetical protein
LPALLLEPAALPLPPLLEVALPAVPGAVPAVLPPGAPLVLLEPAIVAAAPVPLLPPLSLGDSLLQAPSTRSPAPPNGKQQPSRRTTFMKRPLAPP